MGADVNKNISIYLSNDSKEVVILPDSWLYAASSKSCDLEFGDGVSQILNLSSEDTNENHCSQNAPSNTCCLDETADASPEPDVAEVLNLSSDTPPQDSPTSYSQESQREQNNRGRTLGELTREEFYAMMNEAYEYRTSLESWSS